MSNNENKDRIAGIRLGYYPIEPKSPGGLCLELLDTQPGLPQPREIIPLKNAREGINMIEQMLGTGYFSPRETYAGPTIIIIEFGENVRIPPGKIPFIENLLDPNNRVPKNGIRLTRNLRTGEADTYVIKSLPQNVDENY